MWNLKNKTNECVLTNQKQTHRKQTSGFQGEEGGRRGKRRKRD